MLPDSRGNTIPNFSRVGYREGHVMIPMVPVKEILKPLGLPDDTVRIQEAIDRVGRMSLLPYGRDGIVYRGAILLKKGVYRGEGTLVIQTSGVVLRDEGTGTVINATGTARRSFIKISSQTVASVVPRNRMGDPAYGLPQNAYLSSEEPDTFTREGVYIPVGATTLPVSDTTGFNIGDRIVVERLSSQQWINEIGMGNTPLKKDRNRYFRWPADSFTFRFERTIVDIDHDRCTFTVDIPMVMNFDPKYSSGRISHLIHKYPMISDVGLENLSLISEMDAVDRDGRQQLGLAVEIDNTIHGWVSDVSTLRFKGGIRASKWSRFITIQNCNDDGQDGYILKGQMVLVSSCVAIVLDRAFSTEGSACGRML